MLYSQSGLDQFLTVEMLDLFCILEVYPVPGVSSLALAGARCAFGGGTPVTP